MPALQYRYYRLLYYHYRYRLGKPEHHHCRYRSKDLHRCIQSNLEFHRYHRRYPHYLSRHHYRDRPHPSHYPNSPEYRQHQYPKHRQVRNFHYHLRVLAKSEYHRYRHRCLNSSVNRHRRYHHPSGCHFGDNCVAIGHLRNPYIIHHRHRPYRYS